MHADVLVTAFVAIVDPSRGSMCVASAGHPSPFVLSERGVSQMLLRNDPPLGFEVVRQSSGSRCSIAPGSMLIFYTDGLTECTRNVVDVEPKIVQTLVRMKPDEPNPAQILRSTILRKRCADDVAILAVRFDNE